MISVAALFAQNLPNDPAVRVGKLENGLTYYIRHNSNPAGRAEFYLATNVGAIQETPDQDGLAHFLEHMCFNGTKNFPEKGILDYLQSIGASFGGNVNASTGVEQTVYMLNNIPLVRESVIDTCILIMHDYAHFVTNDPVEIDKERGVIIEERRARRNASWRMHEKSMKYYYGDSKYANCTVIGTEENLLNFKPESLTNFYKTWYHPDMQAFIVVGDVDVDKTEEKIKRIFSDIPKEESPKQKEIIPMTTNKEPVIGIITDPEASRTSVEILWKSEAAPESINSTPQGQILSLVKLIIGGVMGERFSDITSKPNPPFLSASLGIGNLTETTEAVMADANMKETEVIPAFKALYTEAEKMKRFGFREDEVERVKSDLLSYFESAAKKASTRKNEELVQELIDNFFDNEPYMEPQKQYEFIQQVMPMLTTEVINQVCAQAITNENMVVVLKAPEKEGLVLPTVEDFQKAITEVRNSDIQPDKVETIATELLDAKALKGSKVKKQYSGIYGSTILELKNGAKVILYPSQLEKDKIQINLYKQGGKSLIPTEDIASFGNDIFGLFQQNSGLSKFSKTELSKMLSGKNANASAFLSELEHGISASSSSKDIETAFQLVYLTFCDPRFDPNEYNKGIEQIKAVIDNIVSRPNYKFSKTMTEVLYGNNPRMLTISKDVIEKASLATIEKNYRQIFNDAAGMTVIIAGDFDVNDITPLVTKYIGSIKKGKKASAWVDRNLDIVSGDIDKDFSVEMETPKTTILDTYTAPVEFNYDNSVALSAVSYILNMRFTKSLREEEGGTYGANSFQNLEREPKSVASLQIYYDCKPEVADKLRSLAAKDISDLAEKGVTSEEFEMTKNNLLKNIPESKVNLAYWRQVLKLNDKYGIDSNKLYEEAVNNLTPEKVQSMMKTLLDSKNLIKITMRPESK